MDILAVANLLNYFGKTDWVDEININPVLIQKGTTKVRDRVFFNARTPMPRALGLPSAFVAVFVPVRTPAARQ